MLGRGFECSLRPCLRCRFWLSRLIAAQARAGGRSGDAEHHGRPAERRGQPREHAHARSVERRAVVIQLRPDVAPNHVERIKTLVRQRLLRRPHLPPRDRRLHGAGRRPDKGDGSGIRLCPTSRPSSPACRLPRHGRGGAHRATRTAPTASSSSCSRPTFRSTGKLYGVGPGDLGHGRGRHDRARRAAAAHPTKIVRAYAVGPLPPRCRRSQRRSGAKRQARSATAARRLMRVDLFDFDLPARPDRAAAGAPARRARLLVVRGGEISDHRCAICPTCCGRAICWCSTTPASSRPSSKGRRGDARIGATLHKREGPRDWRAFVRNAKRVRDGDTIDFGEGVGGVVAEKSRTASALLHFRRRRAGRTAARTRGADAAAALHRLEARRPTSAIARIIRRCSRARTARSPRRPRRCISRAADGGARGAGDRARDADPARRRGHLPAGQGRRHRRPPDARRMGPDRCRTAAPAQRGARGRRAADRGRHDQPAPDRKRRG